MFFEVIKSLKIIEYKQTLADLSSAYRGSQANYQLVQISYIKRIRFFLVSHGLNLSFLAY